MTFLEILLLAVGLSMDSLAVSVASGAVIRNCSVGQILKIALLMGLFQAGFLAVGYALGHEFQKHIQTLDHWIAFILLLYLGGKMVYDSTQEKTDECKSNPLCSKTLCGMAIATSIDALAVGISCALLNEPALLLTATVGLVTILFSGVGVYFGSRFGRRIDLKLDLIGGLILIGIGTKILIEHLFLS